MPDYSTAAPSHPSETSHLFPWSIVPCVAVQTRSWTVGRFTFDLAQGPMKSPVGKEPHATHLAVAPHPSALEKVLYLMKRLVGGTRDHIGSSSSSIHPRFIPIQRSPSLGGFFGGFGFARPQMNDKELWKKKRVWSNSPDHPLNRLLLSWSTWVSFSGCGLCLQNLNPRSCTCNGPS